MITLPSAASAKPLPPASSRAIGCRSWTTMRTPCGKRVCARRPSIRVYWATDARSAPIEKSVVVCACAAACSCSETVGRAFGDSPTTITWSTEKSELSRSAIQPPKPSSGSAAKQASR